LNEDYEQQIQNNENQTTKNEIDLVNCNFRLNSSGIFSTLDGSISFYVHVYDEPFYVDDERFYVYDDVYDAFYDAFYDEQMW